ncbi:MAG: FAD-binding protein, partial [Clostridia bacterium]|nr:FAD-binding protein [Clostridia bacterium]
MRKVLVIGSGISGLTTAIECAKNGDSVILVSPFISERAQSVMAAGGINSVLQNSEDTIQKHIEDTLKGGANIAGEETVSGLCNDAVEILKWLDSIGVMFNRESDGTISRRAFGGQ